MRTLCSIAVLAFAMIALPARAADATYDITVKADATKANGSPWDGVPGLGNTKANLNAAPDIAICVVRKDIKPDCSWRPDGRRLLSMCQNKWTCKFSGIDLQPLPIGMVFLDLDVRNHDIIDTVVLTDKTDEAANEDIAEALRGAMSVLTPHRSEDAKERAVRNAKVLPIRDCASGKPCRLTQSEFTLTKKP